MRKDSKSVTMLMHVCEEKNIQNFTYAGEPIEILDYLTTAIAQVISSNITDPGRINLTSRTLAQIIETKTLGAVYGITDSGKAETEDRK